MKTSRERLSTVYDIATNYTHLFNFIVQQADMEKPNVGYEVTKEVVKLMQELQGVLEL